MKTQDLKYELHQCIENIDDAEFLFTVKQIIDQKFRSDKPLMPLTELQMQRIKQSEDQIKEGKSFTNHQADLLVEKWFSKRNSMSFR